METQIERFSPPARIALRPMAVSCGCVCGRVIGARFANEILMKIYHLKIFVKIYAR